MTEFVEDNDRLRELDRDYDITSKLEDEAGKLPGRLGGAAGTLRDVGFGIVNSLFALITILVMAAFLLGSGRTWVDAVVAARPLPERERLRRALENMSKRRGRLRRRSPADRADRRGRNLRGAARSWACRSAARWR